MPGAARHEAPECIGADRLAAMDICPVENASGKIYGWTDGSEVETALAADIAEMDIAQVQRGPEFDAGARKC